MNVKKAIKRIAALAAGTTMVTATLMAASADLSTYPAPFIEDNVFTGKIVIGAGAQVQDVMGAIDLSASLQAEAKSPVSTTGSTTTVSIDGGVQIKKSSADFHLGDALDDFYTNGVMDDNDFPDILADGIVEDDSSGKSFDYEQTITLGDTTLKFGQAEEYGSEPVFYLDFSDGDPKIVYNVHFKDPLNAEGTVEGLEDSETIEMFGKTFTFDPSNADGEDFTLFASDTTLIVQQGEPVTVEIGGEEYTIEVLGGNDAQETANIRVTGQGTDTKSLTAGTSRTMAGLELFVEDVFISNIGDSSISVSLFVGSDKIVIPDASESAVEIEINGVTDTYINGYLTGDVSELTDITFEIDPTEFDDDVINDNWEWLPMGRAFTDPLFGFELDFDGMSPALDDREAFELTRSSSGYEVDFTNNAGDDISFELYVADGDDLVLGEDEALSLGTSTPDDGDFFILEDTEPSQADRTTYVFEVTDIRLTSDPATFKLKELGSGATAEYDSGDEIEDTNVFGYIYAGGLHLRNAVNSTNNVSINRLVVDGGLVVNLGTIDGVADPEVVNITFTEDADDMDDATVDTFTATITAGTTDDIIISSSWATSTHEANDDGDDYKYTMSQYGTYTQEEIDNNGDFLKVYYSDVETDFNVFFNSPDAVVVRTGSSSSGAYQLNELVVGQIAIYDTDAARLLGSTPLIVVGGPCANDIAAELLGNPEVCNTGFEMNKAMIKYFSGQKALLIAGYEGEDTVAAAQVVANHGMYSQYFTGDEIEVITTSLTNPQLNIVG